MLKVNISSFSLSRDSNEDANSDALGYNQLTLDSYLLAIADGVGSARHSRETANLAIETCLKSEKFSTIPELFSKVAHAIQLASEDEPDQWSTTLTVCCIRESKAQVGHVGDTRIYLLRGNGLQTMTRDHTEVAKLLEEGILTKERAARYPRRNVLLSSMNGKGNFDLYESQFEVFKGDRLLLVSDGVYRCVTKKSIVELSKENTRLDGFIDSLKELVICRGITDDSTALCAEIL